MKRAPLVAESLLTLMPVSVVTYEEGYRCVTCQMSPSDLVVCRAVPLAVNGVQRVTHTGDVS